MKRSILMLLIFVVFTMFLPQAAQADGTNKPRRHAATNCSRLKGKAKQACLSRLAAAAAERRAEIARRKEVQAQALENRFRAESKANIAKDNTEGEDLAIRAIAIDALGEKAGTVVVMDPQSGMIKTIVNQEWGIRKEYTPASTIKLVTATAGISDNVIDDEGDITDPNSTAVKVDPCAKKLGKAKETCEASQFDLNKAIAKSNNNYFQKVGMKVGNEKFVNTAKTYGLGAKTGINAEGESPGKLPYVKKTALQYSHGDGTKVTALQEAVMVSAITNGGRKFVPYIPKPGETFTPKFTQIDVPKDILKELIPGMQGATDFGTARKSNSSSLGVVGKTGTNSDEVSRVGLFASVGPIENPVYTVVVIIRGRKDQTNGPYAARIAGKIYQALLGKEVENTVMAVQPPKPQP